MIFYSPILTPCILKPITINPLAPWGLALAGLPLAISDINNIIYRLSWALSKGAKHTRRTQNKIALLNRKRVHHGRQFNFYGEDISLLPHKQGYLGHILQQTYEQLTAMMSHHSKVMVIRYDFHLHDFTDCNKVMTLFIKKLKRRLQPHYKFRRLGYVWAREWNKGKDEARAQHYHCAIMLDGNLVNYPGKLNSIVSDIWERLGQAHVHYPRNQFYFIKQGDTQTLADARLRLSYLAKVHTKGNKERYTNNYSTSRIRQKYGGG